MNMQGNWSLSHWKLALVSIWWCSYNSINLTVFCSCVQLCYFQLDCSSDTPLLPAVSCCLFVFCSRYSLVSEVRCTVIKAGVTNAKTSERLATWWWTVTRHGYMVVDYIKTSETGYLVMDYDKTSDRLATQWWTVTGLGHSVPYMFHHKHQSAQRTAVILAAAAVFLGFLLKKTWVFYSNVSHFQMFITFNTCMYKAKSQGFGDAANPFLKNTF